MGPVTDRPLLQVFHHSLPQVLKNGCLCYLASSEPSSIITKPRRRPGYLQISSRANSVSLLSHQSEGKVKDAGDVLKKISCFDVLSLSTYTISAKISPLVPPQKSGIKKQAFHVFFFVVISDKVFKKLFTL